MDSSSSLSSSSSGSLFSSLASKNQSTDSSSLDRTDSETFNDAFILWTATDQAVAKAHLKTLKSPAFSRSIHDTGGPPQNPPDLQLFVFSNADEGTTVPAAATRKQTAQAEADALQTATELSQQTPLAAAVQSVEAVSSVAH